MAKKTATPVQRKPLRFDGGWKATALVHEGVIVAVAAFENTQDPEAALPKDIQMLTKFMVGGDYVGAETFKPRVRT
jgi:hypothetical protein